MSTTRITLHDDMVSPASQGNPLNNLYRITSLLCLKYQQRMSVKLTMVAVSRSVQTLSSHSTVAVVVDTL